MLHPEKKISTKATLINGEEIKEVTTTMKKMEISKKGYPKILAVTHGGWIMEFQNVFREKMGMPISEKNITKNTAIYVFIIECKQCKGFCKGTCKVQDFTIKMVVENDNSHLLKKHYFV